VAEYVKGPTMVPLRLIAEDPSKSNDYASTNEQVDALRKLEK